MKKSLTAMKPTNLDSCRKGVRMVVFCVKCKDLVEANIAKTPNLRGANCAQKQTITLINSLEENPKEFIFKCDPITVTARDISFVIEEKNDMIELEFPNEENEIYGLVNGGHRIAAMEYLHSIGRLSESAYVTVQVLYGDLSPSFVKSLVITRNDTMRTDKNDVYNKEGKFEAMKDIFAGKPFADKIAYCSGFEDQYINPQILATIIASFSRCRITYHPVLGDVQETQYACGSLSHGGRAVEDVAKHADEIRDNAEYFNEVIALTKMMDDAINTFAERYPNTRLDIGQSRPPLVVLDEETDMEIKPRVYLIKALPLICALNQLTRYDSETGKYSFHEHTMEFLSADYLAEFIKKFLSSREIFKDKNFKKDTQKYQVSIMRRSVFQQEASRIIREDFRAFKVKKKAEKKAALKVG